MTSSNPAAAPAGAQTLVEKKVFSMPSYTTAGGKTTATTVTCTVTADKGDAGINVVKSELHVTAEGLTGIDAAAFDALVKDAKMKCPISKALNPSIAITATTAVK